MEKEGERESRQLNGPFLFLATHSPPTTTTTLFLINIVHVVRLCLIMHDCYQQQNPLNETLLNGNTIIPPGAQEERQDCWCFFFSPPFYCNKCSMTSISATKYMNEKIRRVTPNGRVEDETIKGDAVGLHWLMHAETMMRICMHARICNCRSFHSQKINKKICSI